MRAHVEKILNTRPVLSEKQRAREQAILATAQRLMVADRTGALTIAKLAIALRMAPDTIRWHFVDIESVLAEIILRHLTEIEGAISKIPQDHPNRQAAARAAYAETTRTAWGALTEPHLLLIRKRHTLPEDLAKPVEDLRKRIGQMLAGERGAAVLSLLDSPALALAKIEDMLAALEAHAQSAKPAQPQTQPKAERKPRSRNGKAITLH
jgi:AcrR family transcriptional regulator